MTIGFMVSDRRNREKKKVKLMKRLSKIKRVKKHCMISWNSKIKEIENELLLLGVDE